MKYIILFCILLSFIYANEQVEDSETTQELEKVDTFEVDHSGEHEDLSEF